MFDLTDYSVLITGGTGSLGKQMTATILKNFPDIKRLVIFSRDELKQFEMLQEFPTSQYKGLRYFIGDIRDSNRLKRALEGIDIVIHTAALKQVPAAEYNPSEFVNTNVLGAENLINASLDCGVKNVVALSTDKAAAPINLYGATKLVSDKLFIAANNIRGKRDIRFSVVRYGNVMGSRGSVVPFFLEKRKGGVLPITHPEMTRFNITLKEGIDLIFYALENSIGGEIFVPKIPSYRITDIAKAIGPKCKLIETGIRPGEKLHEEMITETDSLYTIEIENMFAIIPTTSGDLREKYIKHYNAKPVQYGFKYNSGTNTDWLTVDQIRKLITEHVDPNFTW
jgi:UDP-N-acetylglucosamine 4,6-dehydratase/5-epimerase